MGRLPIVIKYNKTTNKYDNTVDGRISAPPGMYKTL